MTERALPVLVRTALRRAAPELRRKLVLVGVGAVVVGLLDGWRSPFMALLFGGVGGSYLFQVPMDLARDRISGDLHLLTTLPVSAGTVVGAKFLATSVLCLIGALHWPVALAVDLPGSWGGFGPAGALASLPWIWLGTSVASFVGVALLARFELETVMNGPVPAIVVGGVVGSMVFERWNPLSLERLRWIVGRPWFEPALVASLLVVALVVSATAFRLAVRGLEEYRPDPDAALPRGPRSWRRGG